MVDPVLWEQFVALVREPTGDNYIAARSTLCKSAAYRPYSNDIQTAHELLEAGRTDDAVELLMNALPGLLLCPRTHVLLSIVALRRDNREQAETEAWMSHACCQGILGTGDGTKARPYLVIRIEDEYDVLDYLEKQMRLQSLMELNGRQYDVITCEDETEIWFDVTDLRLRGMSQEDLDDFQRELDSD